jgi:hypothetical protein
MLLSFARGTLLVCFLDRKFRATAQGAPVLIKVRQSSPTVSIWILRSIAWSIKVGNDDHLKSGNNSNLMQV